MIFKKNLKDLLKSKEFYEKELEKACIGWDSDRVHDTRRLLNKVNNKIDKIIRGDNYIMTNEGAYVWLDTIKEDILHTTANGSKLKALERAQQSLKQEYYYGKYKEFLEEAVEELENCYGRETKLTEKIRVLLNLEE